jgi:TPR repeat protein
MKIIHAIFYVVFSTVAGATSLEEGMKALELNDYGAAYHIIKQLADDGDKEAQFRMAISFYNSSESGYRDEQLAQSTLLELAEKDYLKAKIFVAMGYELGIFGFQQNDVKYIYWLRKAADVGDPSSMRTLANEYLSGYRIKKDTEKAKSLYERAGAKGDCSAYAKLGEMWHYGKGLSKNYTKASSYYNKSVELGCIETKTNLAKMFIFGQGESKNYAKAERLLNEAVLSKYGSYGAFQMLNYLYYSNYSSNKDPVVAGVVALLQVELDESKFNNKDYFWASNIFADLTSAQQAEARELAKDWKKGSPLPTKSVTGY